MSNMYGDSRAAQVHYNCGMSNKAN